MERMKFLRFSKPSKRSVSVSYESWTKHIRYFLTVVMEVDPSDGRLRLAFDKDDWGAPIFSLYCRQTIYHLLNVFGEEGFVVFVDNFFENFLHFLLSISHDSTLLKILCRVSAYSKRQLICGCLLLLLLLF